MEEKVTVTDKEHTYLVLKWGVNYLLDLYYLWAGGASGLTELERRAAKLFESNSFKNCLNGSVNQADRETERLVADEIKKEIDRELIDSIANLAKDQNKNE